MLEEPENIWETETVRKPTCSMK